MSDVRACNTTTLLELCKAADDYEFNRRAETEKLGKVVDPDGLHVLSCDPPYGLMYHKASFGPRKEPIWPDHHRCLVYVKAKDASEPIALYLDVEVNKYESLMTADQLLKRLDDPVANAIASARMASESEED